MSENGILQKQQYVHGLEYDINITSYSLVPTLLHAFHESKGHQGKIHTFEAIILLVAQTKAGCCKYIDKCSISPKHPSNMTRYPQQQLEILLTPMTVSAIIQWVTHQYLPKVTHGLWQQFVYTHLLCLQFQWRKSCKKCHLNLFVSYISLQRQTLSHFKCQWHRV